ncbi:MAG: hypothetical protein ABIH41_05540 [Nanoarchaeota archaeon]
MDTHTRHEGKGTSPHTLSTVPSPLGLPLVAAPLQRAYWTRLQPINRPAASDTYKRTMSGSSDLFADNFAIYSLAARRPLFEEGADGRLIMAGLEKILYSMFMNPVTEEEVDVAEQFFTNKAQVKKFPSKAWQATLDNGGYMPVDVWGVPGGQTILVKDGKHVPLMSIEGIGALVSHLEPHFEQAYAPIIQATKARLFKEAVGEKFAEFGLRADQTENDHIALMLAIHVGGGFTYTSDDQAVLLFPDLFKDIGTVGHEFLMAYQRNGRSLEEAQRIAYETFICANDRSALLPDIVSTEYSGLPAIMEQIRRSNGSGKVIMPRFDSGDVGAQTLLWKRMTIDAKLRDSPMVVEDGMTPEKSRRVKENYAAAGYDPQDIIVGAGGYFQSGCHRDAISLAYKRSATEHEGTLEASLKFSDSPGKESIPGQIRIYERGDTLIVAQACEGIEGTSLSRKLVENGHIIYNESIEDQRHRADTTWDKYHHIEYSPATLAIINARTREKDAELSRIRREP